VDPSHRAVEVLIPDEVGFVPHRVYRGVEVLSSPLLPGLAIDLREVFPPQESRWRAGHKTG
jgi:hypothetical protein